MAIRFKSIQHRISAVAGACLIASVVSTVGFGVYSARDTQQLVSGLVKENAQANLKGVAGTLAGIIQAKFDVALDATRTMAHVFELGKKENGLSLGRNQINAVLDSAAKLGDNATMLARSWASGCEDSIVFMHQREKCGGLIIKKRDRIVFKN